MAAGEPTPIDPDAPGAVINEPDRDELNGMRGMIRSKLSGTIHSGVHTGRYVRVKQAPGKFKSVIVPLAGCEHDHVLCDIPLDKMAGVQGPLRICLICDAGREMFGLNGKPL